jgi:hypothetical protein
MRSLTIWVLASTLLLPACSGRDGSDESEGVGPEVTASGADAGFVDEGDDPPEGDDQSPLVLTIRIDAPPGADLAGTTIVALEDTTQSDTEVAEIARLELPTEELRSQGDQVELLLPLPLDGSIEVATTVHIDVDESRSQSQGDWVSPGKIPVTAESAASGLTIEIVQI